MNQEKLIQHLSQRVPLVAPGSFSTPNHPSRCDPRGVGPSHDPQRCAAPGPWALAEVTLEAEGFDSFESRQWFFFRVSVTLRRSTVLCLGLHDQPCFLADLKSRCPAEKTVTLLDLLSSLAVLHPNSAAGFGRKNLNVDVQF